MRVFYSSGCLLAICAIFLGIFAPSEAAAGLASEAAFARLKADYPLVAEFKRGENVSRLYGVSFGFGSSPADAAGQFIDKFSGIFGADRDDLVSGSALPDERRFSHLMYDRQTGNYKFTLVYFSQFRDGIPVFKADLRLLVLNRPDYPLVEASSGLRDLGDFRVPAGLVADPDLAKNAALSFYGGFVNFSRPRLVIWAGLDDMTVQPAAAMEIMADNGKKATPDYERWLFIVDARSGDLLYTEDQVLNVDVSGNVAGLATQGLGADMCGDEESTPLPYTRVYIEGQDPVYADAQGDFVIPNGGNSPVTVYSHIRGMWFRVYNATGPDAELSMQVTPPGPANFLHNADNGNQFDRAQVNGYVQANVVRDYTLTYNPEYPVIYQQQEFPVNVNINNSCNAFYDGYSINFFTSGGGCPNTAFSTVVHHEYGHHLVAVAGSQQGAYGEGMGDVMGNLITDDPGLAYGFEGDCSRPLRNADNSMQYPCSGEIHYCGELLSGSVWSTRNALLESYPDTYRDIISGLAINAMLLHRGAEVDPAITMDYLTVDDDDGNIWNGTPHAPEIIQGFVFEHNMDFGVAPQIEHAPLIDTEDSTAVLGVSATVYSFFSMEGGSVAIYYSYGSDYQTIDMANISGDLWYGEIPNPEYGTTISYYLEAIDNAGIRNTSPEGAPDSVYTFYFGADQTPPEMELVESPPNTVNLFGPYGPFIISAWDIHQVDQSTVLFHYKVNDEAETQLNMSPEGSEDQYILDMLDLGRELNTGDIIHFYFTAYDEANSPNMGRLPESGFFDLVMADTEMFEDFEQFGIDRWDIEGSWTWREPGYEGGHSLAYGPHYPVNSEEMAVMNFGYDLSPYEAARITLLHRNALLGDTCFVLISNDGGGSWSTVGFISGYPGNSFYYDEYDISSALSPDHHDYRIGFRSKSDSDDNAGIVMLDNIGWAVGPTTGLEEQPAGVPQRLVLGQNYPNPFNPQTNIRFELPAGSSVKLEIFDIMGRKVATVFDGEMNAGEHNVIWDGKESSGNPASSGIYFYSLTTEFGTRTARMTLLK